MGMPDDRKSDDNRSAEAVGRRLHTLRMALGYASKQGAFARVLGITQQAWNNYESGRRKISVDQALLVMDITGVTLDWIYCGHSAGVPLALSERIAKARDLQQIQELHA